MKLTFSFFLIFLSTFSYSQKGFHLGATGILSNSWLVNQNNFGVLKPYTNPIIETSEYDYKFTIGGAAGISTGFNFTNQLGIQIDLLYDFVNQKYADAFDGPAIVNGTTVGSIKENVSSTRSVKLQWFEIPIMFKFISRSRNSRVKFYGTLGPQFSFLTSATENIVIGGQSYTDQNFPVTKDKFANINIGLQLGFGAEYYVTDNVFLDLGMNIYAGLTDLNSKNLKTRSNYYFSQNDKKYQIQYLIRPGINIGIHYLFGRGMDY